MSAAVVRLPYRVLIDTAYNRAGEVVQLLPNQVLQGVHAPITEMSISDMIVELGKRVDALAAKNDEVATTLSTAISGLSVSKEVQDELSNLKAAVVDLASSQRLRELAEELRGEIVALRGDLTARKTETDGLKAEVVSLSARVKDVELAKVEPKTEPEKK